MFPSLRFLQAGATPAELAVFQRDFDAMPPAGQASRLLELASTSAYDIEALLEHYRDAQDAEALRELPKSDLQDKAAEVGVPVSGTKDEIASRIEEAGSAPGPEPEPVLGVVEPPPVVDSESPAEDVGPAAPAGDPQPGSRPA